MAALTAAAEDRGSQALRNVDRRWVAGRYELQVPYSDPRELLMDIGGNGLLEF